MGTRKVYHIEKEDISGQIIGAISVALLFLGLIVGIHILLHLHVKLSFAENPATRRAWHVKKLKRLKEATAGKFDVETKVVRLGKISGNWSCIEQNISSGTYPSYLKLTKANMCSADVVDDSNYYLTLFTTMYYSPSKMFLFNNTLHVWAKLKPFVNPVLFMTPNDMILASELVATACSLGWKVYSAPLCNEDGYPVLKAMFEVAAQVWNSLWYGYANGDILFTSSLTDSLEYLRQQKKVYGSCFITGQRKDVKIQRGTEVRSLESVLDLIPNATYHRSWGLDYFITPQHGFPWNIVPPFVIGRPQYDNWLTWFAISVPRIMDIDATRGITAVHQAVRKQRDGWSSFNNTSNDFNIILAHRRNTSHLYPRGYNVMIGNSECMRYSFELVPPTGNNGPNYIIYKKRLRMRKYPPRCILIQRQVYYKEKHSLF